MFTTARPDHRYWGPAQHDIEHPLHPSAAGFDPLDLRDEAVERPDDN